MEILHTLKFQLTVFCFLLIFFFSLTLYMILYHDSRSAFLKEQAENISHELSVVADRMDTDLSSIKMIRYYITSETSVKKLLKEETPIGSGSIQLNELLQDKLKLAALSAYVNKLLVATEESPIVTLGTINGMPDDLVRLRNLPGLDVLTDSPQLGALGIMEETLCCYHTPPQAIPSVCSITDSRKRTLGLMYLSLNPNIILDKIHAFSFLEHDSFYLRIDDRYYQIDGDTFVPALNPPVPAADALVPGTTVRSTVSFRKSSCEAIISTLSTENWSLIQLIDSKGIPFGILPPSYLLITVITVCIFLALLLLMQFLINRPVRQITAQLKSGINDTKSSCEEFMEISRGIEQMRSALNSSFQERLKAEEEKKDLEFKMLQYQINPHFIGNSLNTIKWMADLQGSAGISEMALALSNLFCSVIRNDRTFVPLAEELAALRDYITIQRYRYKDIFIWEEEIADPALYDSLILKFTLQPAVENAILHGIVASGRPGLIRLSVSRQGDDILAQIYDNGRGMSDAQMQELFSEKPGEENKTMNRIGIRNIDSRMKMEYGDCYGVSIESRQEEYTLVTVRYPGKRRSL